MGFQDLGKAIEQSLEEVKKEVKGLWIHRQGNEAYGAIYDALTALYKGELKPLIKKQIPIKDNPNAKEFLMHLPPGTSYAKFKGQEDIFADAVGGTAHIERQGQKITLTISTTRIKNKYPYKFDIAKYQEMFLPVHFGYSAVGEIVKDLAGSNLIIAGHPEAGKSNFLHGLIYGLLLSSKHNYPVWPVIIDLKRLEYGYLEDHALIVTEIEQARETLQAINNRLNERLKILESVRPKVVKIQTYLKRGYQMPFILVVIDELAELQDEECQTLLNRILRLGRAVGINVVAATQRPSSTMMKAFGDSKAMFAATMCFHVRDAINSRMLLDNDRAALIPVVKGRAIYQWDKELEVQTMYFPVEEDAKLAKLMKEIEGCTKPGEMVFNDKRSTKRLPPR